METHAPPKDDSNDADQAIEENDGTDPDVPIETGEPPTGPPPNTSQALPFPTGEPPTGPTPS